MIPSLTVKPISENVIRVVTSSGAVVEIQDFGGIGAELHIAGKEEDLRFARFEIVKIVNGPTDYAADHRARLVRIIQNSVYGHPAPRDTQNHNKGQFLGDYVEGVGGKKIPKVEDHYLNPESKKFDPDAQAHDPDAGRG